MKVRIKETGAIETSLEAFEFWQKYVNDNKTDKAQLNTIAEEFKIYLKILNNK